MVDDLMWKTNTNIACTPLIVAFVTVLLTSNDVHAAAETFIDLDASLGLDDNITRAQEDIDIEHDVFISAFVNGSTNLWRGISGSVTGSIGLGVVRFNDFEGLSHYTLRSSVNYVFGFSSGFGAPWYALNASYTFKEFDSFLRDSDTYAIGATFGKDIDDLTGLRVGLNYKLRESDGVVFDTEDVSLFVNIDWSILHKTTLYTTYKVQQGDTFSTASTNTVTTSGPGSLGLLLNDSAIPNESDDVFANAISYRLDSTTHIITVGLNFKQSLQKAYDVSFRFLKSETDAGLEYEDLAILFSYFHKFALEE